jgi:hypothetical protein
MPALAAPTNRPGLSALVYRIGTYGVFLEQMLDQIHAITVPDIPNPPQSTPFSILTTRAHDDPAIALLDAWAVVADVLTFYQERIVNEGYLRTATERRSVLELARAIGYELSPGVAASAYLQFTVEEVIGTQPPATAVSIPGVRIQAPAGPGSTAFNSGIADIPQGTQVQSVPAPGQLPQTFETSADFQARVDCNALSPRLSRTQDLALSNGSLYMLGTSTGFASGVIWLPAASVYLLNPLTILSPAATSVPAVPIYQVYLQGTKTGLQPGDQLLLVGTQGSQTQTQALIVRNVLADSPSNQTRVDFRDNTSPPSFAPITFPPPASEPPNTPFNQANVNQYILSATISESDLQAFLKRNGWDAGALANLVNNPPTVPTSANGVFSFGAQANFFGYNAPLYKSLPDPSKSQRGDPYPNSWDTANDGLGTSIWTDSQGRLYTDSSVFLERSFPQVLANSWTLFETPTVAATAYHVSGVVECALADYGLSGKSTGLRLDNPPALNPYDDLGGNFSNNPAVVSWDHDRLDLFVVGSDGALCHKAWDGSQWLPSVSGFDNLGGKILGSPAVASWDHDRLDIFVVGTDGALYHKAWDGSQWLPSTTGYDGLGGIIAGSPAVISWDHDRLDIFVVGTDGALYHKAWDGSQWLPSVTGYDNLGIPSPGGPILGNPVAVSWDHDRLDVFVIGGTDGALYHKWWDGSQWGPSVAGFEFMGGVIVGNPAAVASDHDRLDVFVVGTDGALYHKAWNGHQWLPALTQYERLGGSIIGDPAVVCWDAERLDIFVVGTDHALYHNAWEGTQWPPSPLGFENLGGYVISNPAVASWSHDRLDVFVLGGDNAVYHKAWNGSSWGTVLFPVRTTTAYIQSVQQALAELPVVDDILAGTTELMLDNIVLGLTLGQPVAISGMRSDAPGVTASEVALLQNIIHNGGFTTLELTQGLQYSYKRASMTISANVTLATHGATVQEVLGNGDASKSIQNFTLSRPPLTYVSAPTASGRESTLHVRVNDLEWEESPTLYGLTVRDQDYIVRIADDRTPTVTFGDPAARPRTGQQNVTATYRTGIGLVGNVSAGSLSLLQSRPPGLRGVTNPLPAGGGADPQALADGRVNAPLTVLTLDRIVSLDDYQNYAQAFPGIGKAQAVPVWSGQKRLIHITLAAAGGGPIDSTMPLYQNLVQGIARAHDPVQGYLVAGYQLQVFNVAASILIDQPTYQADVVMAQVAAALTSAFSFPSRAFAQPVTAAEIITLIQSIPGVIASNLTQLYLTSDGPSQGEPPAYLPALPARWQGGTILPAQLLLLNPLGVSLQEMTS